MPCVIWGEFNAICKPLLDALHHQPKALAEQVVKDIRRATRRHYSAEDKIGIVLSGLRGED